MSLRKSRRWLIWSRLRLYRFSVAYSMLKDSLILRMLFDAAESAKVDEYWQGIRISSTQGVEASSFGMDGAGLLGEIYAL